jgi:hypothetical protein
MYFHDLSTSSPVVDRQEYNITVDFELYLAKENNSTEWNKSLDAYLKNWFKPSQKLNRLILQQLPTKASA